MTLSVLPSTALATALLFSSEEGEHASFFLGLPMTVWQIVNLVLFLAVLIYFVAKPMSAAFRKRQEEIEERRREAEKQKASVERLSADIRERTAKLEREIEEIRKQGIVEGQAARAELARRVAAAREQLHRAAADLMAQSAEGILSREITDADRQRLLTESVEKLKASR